jgi:hypothetical protein
MENQIIKHDQSYPPSASAGGNNAYYLQTCKTLERPASYAACLSRLADIDAGRTNERTSECSKSLREGRCTAAGMREQEQLAGAALFFYPRNPSKPFLPASVAGDFGVEITNLTDQSLIPASHKPRPIGTEIRRPAPAAPKSTSVLDNIDAGGYAAALNAAPAPKPAPVAKAPITKDDLAKLAKPGETMIETAKRLLNQTKEAAHAN